MVRFLSVAQWDGTRTVKPVSRPVHYDVLVPRCLLVSCFASDLRRSVLADAVLSEQDLGHLFSNLLVGPYLFPCSSLSDSWGQLPAQLCAPDMSTWAP